MSEAQTMVEREPSRVRSELTLHADVDVLAATSLAALLREQDVGPGAVLLTAIAGAGEYVERRSADAWSPMAILTGGYAAGTVLSVEGSAAQVLPVVEYLSGLRPYK